MGDCLESVGLESVLLVITKINVSSETRFCVIWKMGSLYGKTEEMKTKEEAKDRAVSSDWKKEFLGERKSQVSKS